MKKENSEVTLTDICLDVGCSLVGAVFAGQMASWLAGPIVGTVAFFATFACGIARSKRGEE